MVFSDALFLLLFLPLLLLVHAVTPSRLRNPLLLLTSLTFYALGEGLYVLLMLGSVAVNYALSQRLGRAEGLARRWLLGVGVGLNLAGLIAFKYANFLTDTLDIGLGWFAVAPIELAPIHLPIGISFFTFECISYLIDVYRREVEPARDPFELALFVALFPHLIAGPILRYADLVEQLRRRTIGMERFSRGVERFSVGLAKKVLIANPLGLKADLIFGLPDAELSSPLAWIGIFAYTLQIYFDFSGYSDMAIGLGRMFGFELCENFNHPYTARSVTDFWRRWHMSLSTWFRDYLYIPLGGNRLGPARTYFNLAAVFVLCGLWHGASFNFLIWGALHGAFLVLERRGLERALKRVPVILQHAYAVAAVMLGWVFFRAETLGEAVHYLGALAGSAAPVSYAQPWQFFVDRHFVFVFACALVGCTAWPKRWFATFMARFPGWFTGPAFGLAFCAVWALALSSIAAGSYSPFIYLRF